MSKPEIPHRVVASNRWLIYGGSHVRKLRTTLGIVGALTAVAVSGTAAAADTSQGGSDESWPCRSHTVCFYSDTDGDGRVVKVSNLPPDCSPVKVRANTTLSMFNNNAFPVEVHGGGAGQIVLKKHEKVADLRPSRHFHWVNRNDC